MTISDTATKFRYEGNGVTDTFAFSGKAFTAGDLVVELITRATDVLAETLTITTDYSVTIATDGTASIEVTNAAKIPSSLQDIQIRRSLAQTQSVVLPTGTKFPAKSVETAIDRAVGLVQDIDEAVNRSLKFPVTSSTTVATLPEPVDDAVLCFDGTTGLFKVGETNTNLVAGATAAAASASAASASASAASSSASAASVSASAASSSASAAAASAAGVSLPSITATDTGKILLVNAAGTAHELISTNGTSGYVLTSAGADAPPAYASIADQIATIGNLLMPVGFIYQIKGVATNPGTLLGFGTWVAITDKFLVASGATYTSTGGAATVTLAEANLPAHHFKMFAPTSVTGQTKPTANEYVSINDQTANDSAYILSRSASSGTEVATIGRTSTVGSGTAFSIIPPYQAVYTWERTV